MDRRFVVPHQGVERRRQLRRGQLAAGLDEGSLDQHPARIKIHRELALHPLVMKRIVEAHHLALDVDRVGDVDRLAQQLGAGLGNGGFAVAGGAVEEERRPGIDGRA